jgi:hypothetical protein
MRARTPIAFYNRLGIAMIDDNEPSGKPGADPKAPYVPKGGEDEGSASQDGNDDHLREDQKPTEN